MVNVEVVQHPLWRIRLVLWVKRLRANWALFAGNPLGLFGLAVILFYGLLVIAYPILMNTDAVTLGLVPKPAWDSKTYDPVSGYDLEVASHPSPPSGRHLLGTDPLGRDVLSQLMYSTRFEFILGIVTAMVTMGIATTVGAVAAYCGGLVDTLLMRFVDLIMMIPALPVLVVLSTLMQVGTLQLAILFGLLFGFGATAVVVKSQALAIKVRPYIEAARVVGGGDWHILFKHLLPNLMPISLLYLMFTVNTAIAYEAILSFFGLTTTRMSWGLMINATQHFGYLLRLDTWWLLLPPCLAISTFCASFYLVGRALDPLVDPRLC
jgi:peptide/nickel transport system permease protein